MVGRLLSFWEGLCLEAKPLVLGIIAVECHLFVVKGSSLDCFLGEFCDPFYHSTSSTTSSRWCFELFRFCSPVFEEDSHFDEPFSFNAVNHAQPPTTSSNLGADFFGNLLQCHHGQANLRWKHLVKSSKRPWQFDIACIFHRVNYSGLHHVKETQK